MLQDFLPFHKDDYDDDGVALLTKSLPSNTMDILTRLGAAGIGCALHGMHDQHDSRISPPRFDLAHRR